MYLTIFSTFFISLNIFFLFLHPNLAFITLFQIQNAQSKVVFLTLLEFIIIFNLYTIFIKYEVRLDAIKHHEHSVKWSFFVSAGHDLKFSWMLSASLHLIHWNNALWIPSTPLYLFLKNEFIKLIVMLCLCWSSIFFTDNALQISFASCFYIFYLEGYPYIFFEISFLLRASFLRWTLFVYYKYSSNLYFLRSSSTSWRVRMSLAMSIVLIFFSLRWATFLYFLATLEP